MGRFDHKACGKRIQEKRKEKGWTQEKLADQLHVSWDTVAKIECGLRKPTTEFIVDSSVILGVSISFLVSGYDPYSRENELRETEETIEKLDKIIETALRIKEKMIARREKLLE